MSITVVASGANESEREKEIRELHSRMKDIEIEYGGFSNIPASNEHEYWSIRKRLQFLLLTK